MKKFCLFFIIIISSFWVREFALAEIIFSNSESGFSQRIFAAFDQFEENRGALNHPGSKYVSMPLKVKSSRWKQCFSSLRQLKVQDSYSNLPSNLQSEVVKKIIYQTALGMQFLHSINIIHRSIDISNIRLDGKDVKITDFSCSQVVRDVENFTGFIGEVSYISPEIFLDQTHSYGTDIWSLGILLYFLDTGKYPFDGQNRSFSAYNAQLLSKEVRPVVKAILVSQEKRIGLEDLLNMSYFDSVRLR